MSALPQEFKPEPPGSAETELALIGAALLNPMAIDTSAPFVTSKDFYVSGCAFVWQTMVDLHSEGIKLTPRLVTERIKSPEFSALCEKELQLSVGQFVARVVASATTVLNAPDYAKLIREYYHRRRLMADAEDFGRAMANTAAPFREACSTISGALEEALSIAEAPRESVSRMIETSMEALRDDAVAPGVTTGLKGIDRLTGGLVPGDLALVGARPSMGKTTFAASVCLGSALAAERAEESGSDEPWGVLYMTHEMTRQQIVQRWLTDLSFNFGDPQRPVVYQRFRPAPGQKPEALSYMQHEGMAKASALLKKLPLAVDGKPGMTIAEVTATVRLHKKRFAARGLKLRVAAFDHIGLGKIMPSGHINSRVDQLGEITSSIKALAVNEEIACMALHQLSRANEGRENKRPSLADFRDSGHIEQDADLMLGLYRDSYYLERTRESDQVKETKRIADLNAGRHELEVLVLKNRLGSVGSVEQWVHMGANAVRDAAPSGYGGLV